MTRTSRNLLTLLLFCTAASDMARAQTLVTELPLMPMPAQITMQPGAVPIDSDFTIAASGAGSSDLRVKQAVTRILPRITRQTGILILPHKPVALNAATLQIVVEQRDHPGAQRLGDNERYSLEIQSGHARLSADAPLGALRGLETFLQLIQPNSPGTSVGFSVPAVQIHDEPRFPWRGLSLDVSRHFIPVDEVRRTLDGMAGVKLNVFHWHLSDDQGFRIESKKFPLLQQKSSDGFYYTQVEVRDVIAYARNLGIRVIPEFDMPGHATSWFAAYPKYASGRGAYEISRAWGVLPALMNPANEATYRFLDVFIGEMASLFPDQYFHIGGDEVTPKEWNENPKIQLFMQKRHLPDFRALQAYFNQRLLKIVTRHGKRMEGWDEILHPDLPKTIVIQSWRGQASLAEAAHEGYDGILSAGYYLDLMQPASQHYAVDPLILPPPKPGAPDQEKATPPAELSQDQKKHILGGEAAMWEELATPENLDAKLWPRLAVIAERLWSPESVNDPASMYRRLYIVNHWLEWFGLTQRSGLEAMRQRLAGSSPVVPLDAFASLLEPVKGYARQKDYTSLSPFNKLVDSIAPESDAGRHFREDVDQYLKSPDAAKAEVLRKELARWAQIAASVRPVLQNNPLLATNIETADDLDRLCRIGGEALDALSSGKNVSAAWKQESSGAVNQAGEPHAEIVLPIAPEVQKLIDAARAD